MFGYCDGLIPIRSFIDKGQGFDGRPHNIWINADDSVTDKMTTFANWAAREGAAVYVIPGTVDAPGQASALRARLMFRKNAENLFFRVSRSLHCPSLRWVGL